MAEWEDEAFEQEEIRKMFEALSAPETAAYYHKIRQQLASIPDPARVVDIQEAVRHTLFLRLVELITEEPVVRGGPEHQHEVREWRLAVVTNSYAVRLPATEADILALACEFVGWFAGEREKPWWAPVGMTSTGGEVTSHATFPLRPQSGAGSASPMETP